MKSMQARLASDKELAEDYQRAHEHYLEQRNAMEDLGTDFSGGGMPDLSTLMSDPNIADMARNMMGGSGNGAGSPGAGRGAGR